MQTIELPKDAPQFGTAPPPPLNISLPDLHEAFSRVASQPGTPKHVSNAFFALMWLLGVDAFRRLEEGSLASGKYEERRDDYRCMLEGLIAEGKDVLLSISQTGLLNLPGGFSQADVSATLESLQAAFYCDYGPKNSPEVNQMIEGLFDGKVA